MIALLRDAHRAVEQARARGDTALGHRVLDDLRERYDKAIAHGIIHNRLRDWHDGNHPGYALGCWLRDYKDQRHRPRDHRHRRHPHRPRRKALAAPLPPGA